ncbi:hypothetical protein GO988_05775 [Hymenobacter sp. HMF4947]|uniref:Uncharacterized protein n=1 Tax=Hymenobacter ginkgonis TaxID=2682976 RepID=A0A7K1TBP0_9BACT|nr:hypothetical protein [Hymenobacter ginkgonis]MVN75830.1 hypothetical protein [Hymenobacter ginkgonis]
MRTRILYLVGVASLALASCATTHTPSADVLPSVTQVQPPDSLALRVVLPIDLLALGLPPYLVPAPAGSTPRQRRQWQKAQAQNLAHAGVLPAKIKNSSVATAPGAVAITRPASMVATGASTATDARKAGTRGGSVAVGAGAVATSTRAGASWWWYLVAVIAGAVGWEVLTSQVTPLRLLLKWRKLT